MITTVDVYNSKDDRLIARCVDRSAYDKFLSENPKYKDLYYRSSQLLQCHKCNNLSCTCYFYQIHNPDCCDQSGCNFTDHKQCCRYHPKNLEIEALKQQIHGLEIRTLILEQNVCHLLK